MTTFEWVPPADIPPIATVAVAEALVPILLWPSFPLVQVVYEELTVIDRFVLEAALRLAPVRAGTVEEVTGIPADAVGRIMGRLARLDLLRPDGHVPDAERVAEVLERRRAPEHRTVRVTLLYLPDTDEMVAFPPGRGHREPPMLNKVQDVERAPVPGGVAGRDRRDLVRSHLAERRIAWLPDDIVDVVEHADDPPAPVGDTCPAYRCRGHVKEDGHGAVAVLDLVDRAGRRVAGGLVLPAPRLAAGWAGVAGHAADAGASWRAAGGHVDAAATRSTEWTYRLDGPAAEAAGRSLRLSDQVGLEIRDDAVIACVHARFEPADRRAAVAFGLNHAVFSLVDRPPDALDDRSLPAATDEARDAYQLAGTELSVDHVLDRLWADQHHPHLYALRAAADFAYD
jgi:hypothetical protein